MLAPGDVAVNVPYQLHQDGTKLTQLSQKLRRSCTLHLPFTSQLKEINIERRSRPARKSLCHTVSWEGLLATDMVPLGAPSGYWACSYHNEPPRAIWHLCITVGQCIRTQLIRSHNFFFFQYTKKVLTHTYLIPVVLPVITAAAKSVLSLAIILPSGKLRK